MNKWFLSFLLIFSAVGGAMAWPGGGTACGPVFVGKQAGFHVDRSVTLTIDDVSSDAFSGAFTPNRKKHFSFGLSPHANWVRFRIEDLLPEPLDCTDHFQLCFNYASFDDIRIYLPLSGEDRLSRLVLKGGIRHGPERDGTGFVFPLFDLPHNVAFDQYVYVRIHGPFTCNFQLLLTERASYEGLKLHIVLFLGFVFGIMCAMIFYNIVLYSILKDKNYLYYVLYLFFMIIYQGTIAGVFKIINIPAADFLTTHVVLLCFLAMAAHLLFAWSYLEVPRTAPMLKIFYRVLWAACFIGAFLTIAARVYQANLMAYAMGVFLPFILVVTVGVSHRNGHRISRYYLLAVGMLLAGVVIFAIRGFGLIEHSIYTSYIVLLAAALESVLFSFALADRVSRLQKKHHTLQLREKELSRISITDELTGLFNRRHFNTMLRHSMEYAQGTGEPLALVLMDIDHFKVVNDRHGHQAGDQVLKALGAIMRKNVRTSDYPCRIGGEEFAVLMLHTDVNGAGNVAERIRQEFEESGVGIPADSTFLTTISVGIAGFQPGEAGQRFFNRADKALYRAKKEGRNRVVMDVEL